MRTFFRNHRILTRAVPPVVALVVAVALIAAVFMALGATGRLRHRATAAAATGDVAVPATAVGPAATASSSTTSPVASRSAGAGTVRAAGNALPATADPATYATAYATALFSYDTRRQSEAAWTAALTVGLDPAADVHPDNIADLADRTPPAAVWATMTSSAQHATFAVTSAWVPTLWTQNATAYPAGAAAITVSGTQQVVWSGGSSSVPQTVTLLLLCPPFNGSCVVNRIAAQVLR